MALTLSALQALCDALITARAKGVLEVEDQNGERVRYASLYSMGRAIANLEARIAAMQGGRVNVVKFKPTKFGEC
jgi:hypothetical protein